jgi:hypothetical protein
MGTVEETGWGGVVGVSIRIENCQMATSWFQRWSRGARSTRQISFLRLVGSRMVLAKGGIRLAKGQGNVTRDHTRFKDHWV